MRVRSLGGKTRRDNSAKVPRKRECGGGLDRRRQGTTTERLHTHLTYHTILNVVYHSILICIIYDLYVKSHLYGIDYSAWSVYFVDGLIALARYTRNRPALAL
jgi:hypothetical protein